MTDKDRRLWLSDSVGNQKANVQRDVRAVQERLHEAGYLDAKQTDGPTGYFGPREDHTIRKFQADNGLVADGSIGRDGETAQALKLVFPKSSPPEPAKQPRQARSIPAMTLDEQQKRLEELNGKIFVQEGKAKARREFDIDAITNQRMAVEKSYVDAEEKALSHITTAGISELFDWITEDSDKTGKSPGNGWKILKKLFGVVDYIGKGSDLLHKKYQADRIRLSHGDWEASEKAAMDEADAILKSLYDERRLLKEAMKHMQPSS